MKSQRTMQILGALALIAALGIAISAAKLLGYDPTHRTRRQSSSLLIGQSVPDISLPIVSGTGSSEGDRISLAALQGHVVLLDFWASYCGPCRQSIPILNSVHARFGDRVTVWGINTESGFTGEQIRHAHDEFGAQFPTLLDDIGEARQEFGVTSIPTLVVIDADSIVRTIEVGVPDEEELSDLLEGLLTTTH